MTTTATAVMDPDPTVLARTATVGTGVTAIAEHRYRNIPVVDDGNRYLGVFGVNSVLRLVLPKAVFVERGLTTIPFIHETLADLKQALDAVWNEPVTIGLRDDVPTVRPDTPLLESLLVLYRKHSSIPVVERPGERLVGVISYFDVVRAILHSGE